MNGMNDYEKGEFAEIAKWKSEEPNIASKAIGLVLQPLVWAAEKAIPHAAIEGALVASNATAEWMTDTADVLRDGQVEDIKGLRSKDLQLSDELADSVHNWAVGIATAEGAGTGVVGLPGLVADVPLRR